MNNSAKFFVLFVVASAWFFSSCCAEAKTRSSAVARKRTERTLVPPPPPTTPAVGQLSLPLAIEMLSDKDLRARRQELALELSQMQERLHLKSTDLKERKERSELFASLYKEGVVSRKEYEGSCQEASEAELTVKETLQKVAALEQSLARVDSRLTELAKSAAKSALAGTSKGK